MARLGSVTLLSAGSYAPPLSTAVQRLKYQGRPDVATPLARWLAGSPVVATALRGLSLVPVPLHSSRLAERGYNQSSLLAAQLGRALGLHVRANCLQRVRATPAQAKSSAAERAQNVVGAFAASGPAPTCVALVDDVVTTGATALACMAALERAGSKVSAIVTVCATTMRDC
ncbi:MAG: ComF family protein [Polyangiaceae bacterium]